MPGEGVPVAVSKVSTVSFAKAKIYVDISLVTIAVVLGYLFFSAWLSNVVGFGTLFAMIYVGYVVKLLFPTWGGLTMYSAIVPDFAVMSTDWRATSGNKYTEKRKYILNNC